MYSLVKAIIIQFLNVKDANLFLDPVPQSAVQVRERVDEVKSATLLYIIIYRGNFSKSSTKSFKDFIISK